MEAQTVVVSVSPATGKQDAAIALVGMAANTGLEVDVGDVTETATAVSHQLVAIHSGRLWCHH